MSSYYFSLLMDASSLLGKVEAESLARRGMSDLRNQSSHCSLVVSALYKLHH
jgi:hypothetical protein